MSEVLALSHHDLAFHVSSVLMLAFRSIVLLSSSAWSSQRRSVQVYRWMNYDQSKPRELLIKETTSNPRSIEASLNTALRTWNLRYCQFLVSTSYVLFHNLSLDTHAYCYSACNSAVLSSQQKYLLNHVCEIYHVLSDHVKGRGLCPAYGLFSAGFLSSEQQHARTYKPAMREIFRGNSLQRIAVW